MAFDQAIADRLTDHMASGESLRKACEIEGQNRSEAYKWLENTPSFADQYARADAVRAIVHAERIEDLTRKVVTGELKPDAARVAIDALKWTASKLHAKRYGDRIDHTHDVTSRILLVDARSVASDVAAQVLPAAVTAIEHDKKA